MSEEFAKQTLAEVQKYGIELDRRVHRHNTLSDYRIGNAPLPAAVVRAKVTAAYQILMPFASSNWAGLIVDSVLDRLALSGIRSEDKATDDAVWGIWQDNQMDSESKLAHDAALTDGRCFATVWPDSKGDPRITLDDSSQMIVAYAEGSRRQRVAALRRWVDDTGVPYATLYKPDGIYKFEAPKGDVAGISSASISPLTESTGVVGMIEYFKRLMVSAKEADWKPRTVAGEEWPLKNPTGVVPVVEIGVNRRLEPGIFSSGQGEFAHSTGHIDRINILTFLGLVVAFWMGFPLRTVIGERILKDDDGQALQPFVAMADTVSQFENPNVKLEQFDAADLSNFSVEEHVKQLAAITKTPAHYLLSEMVNLSADAIRAAEAALNSKVTNHKASLGEGWEEVLRIAGMMLDDPVELSPRAEVLWEDHEARSMAERADAALKLKEILPWQPLAEKVLGATQDEIARWEAMRNSSALDQIVAEMGNKPDGEPAKPGEMMAVPA